jgi:glycosyltransferase involved in cell wall biosynthesis
VDFLEDGAAGLLVDRTGEAVGDAMIKLGRDPDLRSRTGGVARQRALAFGPERFTKSVLEAYRVLGW